MNTRKGFTLVELLVVIAILAILATVSVVGYTAFISSADDGAALSELSSVKTFMEGYDLTAGNRDGKVSIDEVKAAVADTTTEVSAKKDNISYDETNKVVIYQTKNAKDEVTGSAYWNLTTNTLTQGEYKK